MLQIFELGLNDEESGNKSDDESKPKKSRAPRVYKPRPRKRKEQSEDGEPEPQATKMIVGIDFGTTYSGVSIVTSESKPDKIKVENQWPGQKETRVKVPSTIAYDVYSNKITWGYQVSTNMHSSAWFKLKLPQNGRYVEQDDPLLVTSVGKGLFNIPIGKIPEELACDYLKCLYEHVTKKLKRKITPDLFREMPMHYVLTAPADWGPEYKATLRSIAKDAGIGCRKHDKIMTIDEPEAAALAAFQEYPAFFKGLQSSNVVVVDMGGGTVVSIFKQKVPSSDPDLIQTFKDIITYTILRTVRLRVEEACPGTSAKCGGTTVDRELHSLMQSRYKEAFSLKSLEDISVGSQFMDNFESLKRNFEGCGPDKPDKHTLPLAMNYSGDSTYDRELQSVILTSEEIAKMFDRVITPSLELVSQQITITREKTGQPVKCIVLCGGLAGSPYVQSRFSDFCKQDLEGEVDRIVPRGPWDAVARGAALYGLNKTSVVKNRSCRRSYGIVVHKKFDPEIDREEISFTCPENGKRARGYMHWYIKQGEAVQDNKGVKWIDGYITLDGDSYGEMKLYQSHLSEPGNKVYDKDVKLFGTLPINFRKTGENRP